MAKLIVHPGTAEQADIELHEGHRVLIGRSRENDVVVDRRMASRAHAALEHMDGSYYVVDRNSYNGTFVNETPITRVKLTHGDRIRVASCFLRFAEHDDDDGEDTLQNAVIVQDPEETFRTGTAPGAPLPLEIEEARASVDRARRATETDPAAAAPEAPAPESLSPSTSAAPAPIQSTKPDESTSPVRSPAANGTPATSGAPAASGAPTASGAPAASGAPGAQGDRTTTSTARARPGAVRGRSGNSPRLRDWRVWAVVAALVVAALAFVALRHGDPESDEPVQTPVAADQESFDAALMEVGEARIDRLWEFVISNPESPLLERAYVMLIDLGASKNLVCEHVSRAASHLLETESALSQRCTR